MFLRHHDFFIFQMVIAVILNV